ncbi:MAG: alpha/beta fold hydrolase, partial [Myxococcus sp.]|nr:alpha/beta fold hydrolase [Myxococcus sp.]
MFRRRFLLLSLLAATAQAQTTFSVMVNGASFQVDRYAPPGSGPFPLVALGHGFSNSKDNVRGLAQALQADGAVVVAPQFPAGSGDHPRNALVLLAAVDATIAAGLGDGQRVAFGGHSAGALAAWLAAAQRPQTRAVVLLDPVDSNGLGAAQVASVTAPALFEFAPPQMCNTQNNTVPWFTAKSGLKGRFNVPMANHCDPQEPSNSLCTLGCSFATWSATRSGVYKRYARAFFGQFLLGNAQCVESMAVIDAASGTIDAVTMVLGNQCAGDGGTGGGPAGGGSAAGGGLAVGGGSAVTGGGSAAGGSAAGGSAAGGSAAGGSAAGGSAAGG